jgi:hypothetical protein
VGKDKSWEEGIPGKSFWQISEKKYLQGLPQGVIKGTACLTTSYYLKKSPNPNVGRDDGWPRPLILFT